MRALLVTPARGDATRWLDVVRDSLSLDVHCARTIEQAARLIGEAYVDVAIVGAEFPDGSHRDALRALKAVRDDLPVIVVAAIGRDDLHEAYALGAAEVLAPQAVASLALAIKQALRDARAAGRQAREPLPSEPRRAVTHVVPDERDPVTQLPHWRALERQAQHVLLSDCERNGGTLALFFIDIDRFHVVNDLADHGAGDGVLREVADRLRAAVPVGYLARFGGDEFVMLYCERATGATRNAAEAVLHAFDDPFVVRDKPVYLTASVGVAVAPRDTPEVRWLIGAAETAVFEAKRFGRNTVRWYHGSGAGSSLEDAVTRRDLQGAIEREEFELYYQPMYDLRTRSIDGVEALLRWRHPVRGLVLPDHFIPIAEQYGLTEEIGTWVLNRALAQMRLWRDAGIRSPRVSINVSARQLESVAFVESVKTALESHDVAPASLELELTESAIMRDVPTALRLLSAVHAFGVRVSIDDFGTGYTSLGFLKKFAFDVLKIDRSFVQDVGEGEFGGAVVRAVTTLARALGVRTVAEGVEDEAQVARLLALDCDLVQGFLFCRPLPVGECTQLIATVAV